MEAEENLLQFKSLTPWNQSQCINRATSGDILCDFTLCLFRCPQSVSLLNIYSFAFLFAPQSCICQSAHIFSMGREFDVSILRRSITDPTVGLFYFFSNILPERECTDKTLPFQDVSKTSFQLLHILKML